MLNHIGKRSDWFQTCVTCVFFNAEGICTKFNSTPPAQVIADGCEAYEDEDIIPF